MSTRTHQKIEKFTKNRMVAEEHLNFNPAFHKTNIITLHAANGQFLNFNTRGWARQRENVTIFFNGFRSSVVVSPMRLT